ncbi:DNA mismatch repair protein [Vibrio sonorensis]|uniref:DNA mismatch repair protein n=1 Tax=Vibrio sonorensis TaxID=1004316 RepID=UPI0008D8FBD5|nr:DNA mismatch repair protein [Vibrio sonorensis]
MVIKKAVPPAWLLVLIGLLLNIAAIVMSSIVLDDLSDEVAELSEKKEENLYSIQLAWNHVETLERKREFLLLYFSIANDQSHDNPVTTAVKEQLAPWINSEPKNLALESLPTFLDKIEMAQQVQRNRIDDLYLGNVAVSEQMLGFNERIAWYKNIGLFLQVFGLALILARDLARKP